MRFRASIGTTIFGAFVAMGLLIAALGGYGLYVLQAAGGFVVELYDRPLMAINYDRAASLDFAGMDKELIRRAAAATDQERAAIDKKIEHLSKLFNDDLAVAAARSVYDDEKAVIGQIQELVAQWNDLRRRPGAASVKDPGALAAKVMERFDVLAELATGHSFVQRRKVVADVAFFEYTSAAALILALLLSGCLTLLLVRRIVRPLRNAAAIADRIAAGELQAPIPAAVRDETGLTDGDIVDSGLKLWDGVGAGRISSAFRSNPGFGIFRGHFRFRHARAGGRQARGGDRQSRGLSRVQGARHGSRRRVDGLRARGSGTLHPRADRSRAKAACLRAAQSRKFG